MFLAVSGRPVVCTCWGVEGTFENAHQRNGKPEQAHDSDRVAKRTALLIENVDLPEVRAIAIQMQHSTTNNTGEYAAFFEKWGYDAEQKLAIANALS